MSGLANSQDGAEVAGHAPVPRREVPIGCDVRPSRVQTGESLARQAFTGLPRRNAAHCWLVALCTAVMRAAALGP